MTLSIFPESPSPSIEIATFSIINNDVYFPDPLLGNCTNTGCLKKTPLKEMCDFLTLKMLPLVTFLGLKNHTSP